MLIDDYKDWAWEEFQWIRNLLCDIGPETLAESCEGVSQADMRDYMERHRGDIRELYSVPEPERGAILHRYPPGKERHLFLIAAAYRGRLSTAMLDMMSERGLCASYAPSRSGMFVAASDGAYDLLDSWPTLWPFDDWPDPFGEIPG